MGEEARAPLGSNGSVFNKRKQITAEAAERINATFRGKKYDRLALCGCGMSKETLFEILHDDLRKKTVLVTVAYTGKPAWAEAVRVVREDSRFNAEAEGVGHAKQWLQDLIDPNETTSFSGQKQCLLALQHRLVRRILLGKPAPPPLPGIPDLEDFLNAECEEAGVELIRVADAGNNDSHMFFAYGGIGAYFHHGHSEDDLDKIDGEAPEEEVEARAVPNTASHNSYDIFNDTIPTKQTSAKPPKHVKATLGSIGKSKRKQNVNLVFCGHVDAGKSTTVGHLLVKTGAIDQRTVERSGAFRFAHLLDVDPEERERGVTVECGFHSFETDKRQYTIIDAPGHQNFLVNFIAGANQADVAVLLLSARAHEFEDGFHGGQTKEHCKVIRGLDIKRVVLAVNKMDACDWNAARYEEIVGTMREYLVKTLKFDKKKILHVPISGFEGLNLTQEDVSCTFSPGCLVDRLETFKIKTPKIQDLRITINERERFGNKIRVQGKVECGVLKKAQTVMLMPENISAMVVDISVATEDVSAAYPGELVTMFIRGVGESDFSIGSVMCDNKNPTLPVKKITALVQLCKEETIMKGYRGVFHSHALIVEAEVCAVKKVHRPKCNDVNCRSSKCGVVKALQREGQWAEIRLGFSNRVAVEAYDEFKRLGSFVLRKDESTVAFGRVVN